MRSVRFGDGYEQRLLRLNQNPKVGTLSFVNLAEADSTRLKLFADAR